MNKIKMNYWAMLLISIFGGFLGIDRFILKQTIPGLIKMFTCGGFGVWWLLDVLLTATKSHRQLEYTTDKNSRNISLIIIIAVVIFGIIANLANLENTDNKDLSTVSTDLSTDKSIKPTEKPTKKPSEMTIDEFLKAKIKKVYGEKTNMGKKSFISLTDGDPGIKNITLNASENFNNSMTVKKMSIDAKSFLEEISKNKKVLDLEGISLIYEMDLKDVYGNVKSKPVVIITVSTATIKKINWENFLFEDVEKVADTYYIHPALKK